MMLVWGLLIKSRAVHLVRGCPFGTLVENSSAENATHQQLLVEHLLDSHMLANPFFNRYTSLLSSATLDVGLQQNDDPIHTV